MSDHECPKYENMTCCLRKERDSLRADLATAQARVTRLEAVLRSVRDESLLKDAAEIKMVSGHNPQADIYRQVCEALAQHPTANPERRDSMGEHLNMLRDGYEKRIAGMEMQCRETHQGIARVKAERDRARAESGRLKAALRNIVSEHIGESENVCCVMGGIAERALASPDGLEGWAEREAMRACLKRVQDYLRSCGGEPHDPEVQAAADIESVLDGTAARRKLEELKGRDDG